MSEPSIFDADTTYDATKTMMVRRPESIEEMRVADPQRTIDYLLERKKFYKHASRAISDRKKELEAELATARTENEALSKKATSYKSRYRKELRMKRKWQIVTATMAVACCLMALLTMSAFWERPTPQAPLQYDTAPSLPTSGVSQKTPDYVLGSVYLRTGYSTGSGTVISKGEEFGLVLTAAHVVKNGAGAHLWVYNPDGTYIKGEQAAIDEKRDLALVKVPSEFIIGRSFVPEKMQGGEIVGVGYPYSIGPTLKNLTYESKITREDSVFWNFKVDRGPFWEGDSGGGIFQNGGLIGVMSQRDAFEEVVTVQHQQERKLVRYRDAFGRLCSRYETVSTPVASKSYSKRLYARPHSDVVAFLSANAEAIKDCGAWNVAEPTTVATVDAPPLWSPSPNIPIIVENSEAKAMIELQEKVEVLEKTTDDLLQRPGDVGKKPAPSEDDNLMRPSEIR